MYSENIKQEEEKKEKSAADKKKSKNNIEYEFIDFADLKDKKLDLSLKVDI